MGYPFDRQPRLGVNTLAQFVTSNMFVQTVSIRFSNRVVAALPTRPTQAQGTQGQGQGQNQGQGQGTRGQGNQQPSRPTQPTRPGAGGRP